MLSPTPTIQALRNPAQRSTSSYGGGGGGDLISSALVALLLVIVFVALLHVYAKLFLTQQNQSPPRIITTQVFSASLLLAHTRFRRHPESYPTKGLDSSAIAKIPLFVYREEENPEELECVICLTAFEGGEIGRKLGKCGHGFHVDCIDMWLGSHSSCPTCRALASGSTQGSEVSSEVSNVADASGDSVGVSEIVVEVPSSGDARVVGGMGGGSGGDASLVRSSASQAAAGLGGSLKRMLRWSVSGRKSRSLSNVVVTESDNLERE
ncbi:RING-H2 finger protein ATL63 [Rhododendron vialii]|uniref:RING-H2 finger protein ATL63 n=1 Tax=Rhododendron vialii TaxID=182163 RepID=UPI00265F9FE4|nr:RING-H2 finger protein ATL63 [Rhododendron vialii]